MCLSLCPIVLIVMHVLWFQYVCVPLYVYIYKYKGIFVCVFPSFLFFSLFINIDLYVKVFVYVHTDLLLYEWIPFQ